MSHSPKISVIIPVYNASQYLRECLDSVLSQSLEDIEVICIDDGSTDDSLDILKKYHDDDKRVIILQQKNQGSGIARNFGIYQSSGQFIAFMDSDDWYPTSDILETMVRAAEKYDVPICGGSACHWDNGYLITEYYGRRSGFRFLDDGLKKYSEYQCPYAYWRFIYNRNFLNKHNIMFPVSKRGQDMSFFVRALVTADSFYGMRKITYCYRVGHKRVQWDSEKTNDYLVVIRDLFQISRDYNLKKLHLIIIKDYIQSYMWFVNSGSFVNNKDFSNLISEINTYTCDKSMIIVSNKNRFVDCIINIASGNLFQLEPISKFGIYVSYCKCCLLFLYWEIEEKGVKEFISAVWRHISVYFSSLFRRN